MVGKGNVHIDRKGKKITGLRENLEILLSCDMLKNEKLRKERFCLLRNIQSVMIVVSARHERGISI